jgi:hypothetical protein
MKIAQCQKPSLLGRLRVARAPPARASVRAVKSFLEPAPAPAGTVPVQFKIVKHVEFGESLRVVGSDPALGGWEVEQGVALSWSEGDVWSGEPGFNSSSGGRRRRRRRAAHNASPPHTRLPAAGTVDLPVGASADYKLVHVLTWTQPAWEPAPNRAMTVAEGEGMTVGLGWADPEASVVEVVQPAAPAAPAPEEPLQPGFQAAAAAVENFAEQFKFAAGGGAPAAPPQAAAAPLEVEVLGEEAQAAAPPAPAPKERTALQAAATTAGYVALGVAGAAVLGALAIDVADTAVLGAMVAAAGGAALSGGASKGGKGAAGEGAAGEGAAGDVEVEGGAPRPSAGAGEPGIIMAAGLMSAFDAGKAMVQALDGSAKEAAAEAEAAEEAAEKEEA